ncbi:hypothetical protein ACB092_10G083300 [Castanea dentata]
MGIRGRFASNVFIWVELIVEELMIRRGFGNIAKLLNFQHIVSSLSISSAISPYCLVDLND